MKVRGPAAHIYERYLQLARDASSSGDRVMGENYLQHAEHYFRLWRAMQPATPPPQQHPDRFGGDMDYEDEEGGAEGEQGGGEAEAGGEAPDQPEVDFPGQQQGGGEYEQRDGEFRRRRGRRNRFRPDGERAQGEGQPREGGGQEARGPDRAERPERQERGERPERAERPDRPERNERRPRDNGGEQTPAEGFSDGPKPAFLRTAD